MTKKLKKEPSPNRKPWQLKKDVRSLRTPEAIESMKWALKRHCTMRDYVLFLVGINTGLRCGDLLKLKIEDVKGKKEVKVTEGKTGKTRLIYLSAIYTELNAYIDTLGTSNGVLFPSRKGNQAITITQAYRQLNKAAEWAEVEHIGTHTMRKTFAYFLYRRTNNPALVMEVLNHSSWSITRRYIGLAEEEIGENMANFKL